MLRLNAPAKINLYLAVKGLRDDGYHELETVFQAIDLADVLELSKTDSGISIAADWPGLTTGEDNICHRAARMLKERYNVNAGAMIGIYKKIPPGAGLGGGSSNAASVLLGLNRLWGLGISRRQLARHAADLGSDVPFFLDGPAALARGRGEVLSPVPSPRLWLVVTWPGTGLSTPEVYREWDRRPEYGSDDLKEMLAAIKSGDGKMIARAWRNDLQSAAVRLSPECGRLKERLLEAGCLGAMVSGSGSAVFGIAPDVARAKEIAGSLANDKVWARAVPTLCGDGVDA